MLQTHQPISETPDLYIRKLQAAGVLAALMRMRLAQQMSEEDKAYLSQGLELMASLIEGRKLFSDDKVTKRLVNAGTAFFAAARALDYSQRDQLKACERDLVEMQETLDSVLHQK